MWSKEYTYDLKMDGQELQEGRQEYVVRFRVRGGGGQEPPRACSGWGGVAGL